MARIGLQYTTPDGVWTLDVARQAGALGQAVAQQLTLSVWSTGRGVLLAGILRRLTWHLGWFALETWQTEALHLTRQHATTGVEAAWIALALFAFGNCRKKLF